MDRWQRTRAAPRVAGPAPGRGGVSAIPPPAAVAQPDRSHAAPAAAPLAGRVVLVPAAAVRAVAVLAAAARPAGPVAVVHRTAAVPPAGQAAVVQPTVSVAVVLPPDRAAVVVQARLAEAAPAARVQRPAAAGVPARVGAESSLTVVALQVAAAQRRGRRGLAARVGPVAAGRRALIAGSVPVGLQPLHAVPPVEIATGRRRSGGRSAAGTAVAASQPAGHRARLPVSVGRPAPAVVIAAMVDPGAATTLPGVATTGSGAATVGRSAATVDRSAATVDRRAARIATAGKTAGARTGTTAGAAGRACGEARTAAAAVTPRRLAELAALVAEQRGRTGMSVVPRDGCLAARTRPGKAGVRAPGSAPVGPAMITAVATARLASLSAPTSRA
jgi:hypothetical protein